MILMEVFITIFIAQKKTVFLLQGRTLSVLSSTQVQIDPDVPLAHDLRRWYLEEGMNVEMTDLTIQSNLHENSKNTFEHFHTSLYPSSVPWKTFGQLTEYESNMSSTANGETFRIKAVCTYIRHDPIYKVKEMKIKLRN